MKNARHHRTVPLRYQLRRLSTQDRFSGRCSALLLSSVHISSGQTAPKTHHRRSKTSPITMAAAAPRPGPIPSFSALTFSPALSRFDLPAREYISRLKDVGSASSASLGELDGIAVGALVFKATPPWNDAGGVETQPARVLLIQRAKTDSLPEKWEIPSGVVSNSPEKDATIIRAVARELWEETGFMTKRIVRLVVGPDGGEGFVFSNSTKTKVFCRYVFEVEVDDPDEVRLNPWEHQDFVWASEDEVANLEAQGGDRKTIELTSSHLGELILEAFRSRKANANE